MVSAGACVREMMISDCSWRDVTPGIVTSQASASVTSRYLTVTRGTDVVTKNCPKIPPKE